MFANLTILNLQMCDSLTNQADFTIYIWPLELKKPKLATVVNPLPSILKEKEQTSLSAINFW